MQMRQLQDHECAARCQSGDVDAFAELVSRYQNRIYRFILRMIGSREEALELTQDTFLKAFQAIASWRPDALFHTWLFRIASNTAMDTLRRRKLVQYEPLDDHPYVPDGGPGIEAELQLADRVRALELGLQQLPHLFREALLLREVEGMSYAEIGAALNLTQGTVKSRIARARCALMEICRNDCGE